MNQHQINKLLSLIVSVEPDELDCDSCCQQIAEFAEIHLLGKSLEQSHRAVEVHLKNCHCCEAEFRQLLAALADVEET